MAASRKVAEQIIDACRSVLMVDCPSPTGSLLKTDVEDDANGSPSTRRIARERSRVALMAVSAGGGLVWFHFAVSGGGWK